jgi:hypothetical protein
MNSDEAATGPSCGDPVAAASDGLETATAKSLALAGTPQLEKTEATIRMEKQRGDFTAGFLSEPAKSHPGVGRGERGFSFIRETESRPFPGL